MANQIRQQPAASAVMQILAEKEVLSSAYREIQAKTPSITVAKLPYLFGSPAGI